MEDFISSILSSNLDFAQIGGLFLVWIAALWVVFCVWVYVDSKKRHKSSSWAIFWFCVVLILNFPALVLYLIIRPENEENHVIYIDQGSASPVSSGGVNVPLVNFTGEDGEIKLSLSLSLNKNVSEDVQFDFKVNNSTKFQVQEPSVSEKVSDPIEPSVTVVKEKNRITLSSIRNKAGSIKNIFKSKSASNSSEVTQSSTIGTVIEEKSDSTI